MESVQKMLKAACEDSGEVDFRNDYSGRGMFGDRCVGITGSLRKCQEIITSIVLAIKQEVFETAIDCADNEEDAAYELNDKSHDMIEHLLEWSYDQMGLDIIIYFPRLKPLEDSDELPTDEWFDEQSEKTLLQWVADNSEYHTAEDDVENHGALLATAKLMRDRMAEDVAG